MASPGTDEPVRERRRLVLKPRDETAAQAASIERAASGKSVRLGVCTGTQLLGSVSGSPDMMGTLCRTPLELRSLASLF